MHFEGMWSGTFYLGTFLGPTVAGVLVDSYGFKFTSMVYCFFFVGSLILNIVEIIDLKSRHGYQLI